MTTCPRCHTELREGARFCPNCGLELSPLMLPTIPEADRLAIPKLLRFAMIYTVTIAVEILYEGLLLAKIVQPPGYVSIAYTLITSSAQVLGLIYLISGFKQLLKADSRFSTAASLTRVLPIALLVVACFSLLAESFIPTAAQTPTNSSVIAQFLVTFAVAGVGGILALIGDVGVIMGLWRVGTRYGENKIKAAAILFIIPYVNIAGTVSAMLALRRMKGDLDSKSQTGPPTGSL